MGWVFIYPPLDRVIILYINLKLTNVHSMEKEEQKPVAKPVVKPTVKPATPKVTEQVEEVETPEETKPVIKPTSKTLKLSDGSDVTIHRLKAGSYYKAQKVFADWIKGLFSALEETEGEAGIDPKDYLDEKGQPDEAKIKKSLNKTNISTFQRLIAASSDSGEYKLDLVAISLKKTIEELEQLYYPEDIERMVKVIIDLNNFIENLKNSVAPMSGLGAK